MTCSVLARKHGPTALLVSAISLCLLLSGCGGAYHAYRVAGDSMLPLLHPGDRIFVDESDDARSDLHDGDVIALSRGNLIVLKRILAMPGESISSDHRRVLRDGKELSEPYLAPPSNDANEVLATFPPRTVGARQVFVMGDNRDVSLDSRVVDYAPVRFSDVIGKYSWTYWHASASK